MSSIYNSTPVYLPQLPHPHDTGNNVGIDPQPVSVRKGNLSITHLDTSVMQNEPNKAELLLSSVGNPLEIGVNQPQLLLTNVRRFAVSRFGITACFNNVTRVNNSFRVVVDGTTYSGEVGIGRFLTRNTLMNALVTGLNAALAAAGSVDSFSTSAVSTNETYRTLTCTKPYHFDVKCNAVVYGLSLWNLPREQTDTLSKTVGAIHLFYTRYVDLTSLNLSKHSRNPNRSNGTSTYNLIHRFYFDDPTASGWVSERVRHLSWHNFNNTEMVNTIDCRLYDQYGFRLEVNTHDSSSLSGFDWEMSLMVSI